jgi:RND superfamily putative drug exporter
VATLLYRLGRFSFRRRRAMLALWAVLLGLFALGAVTLSGPTSGAFSIPGTESSRALDVLRDKMGAGAGGTSATVVFTGTDLKGPAVSTAIAELGRAPQVAAVSKPTYSQDQQTAYVSVSYTVPVDQVTDQARDALTTAGRSAESAGVQVAFSGEVTQEQGGPPATEGIGLIVAAFVLVLTFGSLIAAGLPLISAIIGVGLGMLGIRIATGFFDLSDSTSALATMLGLAVAIDYALFVVSRYRHEVAAGRDGEEAAGRAAGTAGSAVVFAGLTVVIALAALAVTGIPFLTAMGLAAAATVAGAVLITLTLVPALLGFAGRRVAAKPRRRATGRTPFGERWARLVLRHRVVALVLSLGVLGAAALPALDLRLALPDDSTAAVGSTQRLAYDRLAAGFGPGFNGPLIVVVEGDAKTASAAAASAIKALPGVAAVTPATVNPAGDTAMLTVIPGSGPADQATKDLVAAIRDTTVAGGTLAVTGTTAVNIDVSDKLSSALIPYLAIVVGLAFVLLMLVFRSLLVPLKATLGFLLSIAATFGAVVTVFQHGHFAGVLGIESTGPIVSLMPIFLIGILFGLAMDYEVFLVTRTREEYVHGAAPDEAIATGMRHGARVVTAAALIMMSVFAGFILADDSIIKSLGFALAFGVAVDAFVVRMTIVPAVLSLLGRAAWWLPAGLARILPDVDVEGDKLARRLAAEEPERELMPVA